MELSGIGLGIEKNGTYPMSVWLHIKLKGNDKLLLGCVYRAE
jgi:hypothetical protein